MDFNSDKDEIAYWKKRYSNEWMRIKWNLIDFYGMDSSGIDCN